MGRPSALNNPPDSDPELQLVVHAGPLAGKGFPFTGDTLTFGRDPENDIYLDDDQVSRFHARLIRDGDKVLIEDLGSTNGTLVNGNVVEGQRVLQPADIISIGSSVFGVKGFGAPSTIGLTQLTMDRPSSYPSPQPTPQPSSRPSSQPVQSSNSRLTVLAIGGVIAFIAVIIILALVTVFVIFPNNETAEANVPNVVITSPVEGSQVPVGEPVTIQATASDQAGIVRMELWLRGQKLSEATSPVSEGQPTLTASFQWTPEEPGTYPLEVRAFNTRGTVNNLTSVSVTVIGEGSPTPEGTDEPTATLEPGDPSLTTLTDLRVRAGPGIEYDLLGLLPTGSSAEIVGQDETRQWWQIRFAPAAEGIGWVSAEPSFGEAENVNNIPVVVAPPTPTATPTVTQTPTGTPPPTNTPTATPTTPAETATPTPTLTNTPQPTQIEFDISPTNINGGQCVTITWSATGVKEVYLNDQGIAGVGSQQACPPQTTTYRFRVVRQDNSEYREEVTVQVSNPVVSSGSIVLEPNEGFDFDQGGTPQDFEWVVEDDRIRFEVRGNTELAPMRDISSLDSLSRSDCENADYEDYEYIDARAPGSERNSLIGGRGVCYRTDQGNLGKLRFPDASTGDLRIEWLTWR